MLRTHPSQVIRLLHFKMMIQCIQKHFEFQPILRHFIVYTTEQTQHFIQRCDGRNDVLSCLAVVKAPDDRLSMVVQGVRHQHLPNVAGIVVKR